VSHSCLTLVCMSKAMVEHLQANVSVSLLSHSCLHEQGSGRAPAGQRECLTLVSLLSACARLTYCHVYSRECLHYHYFGVGYLTSIISRVTSAKCMLQTARFEFYSAPIVCVCVSANISPELYVLTDFCACYLWPGLGPPLAASRYVMYFRFCG